MTHVSPARIVPAQIIIWVGYIASFVLGLILWPQLIELGFLLRNDQFGFALLFNWFCLPVSMSICWLFSIGFMQVVGRLNPSMDHDQVRRNVQIAALFGVVSTLGSCGMIALGYEPPQPFSSIYDVEFGRGL